MWHSVMYMHLEMKVVDSLRDSISSGKVAPHEFLSTAFVNELVW